MTWIDGVLVCGQSVCLAPAAYRVGWPGRDPMPVCDVHKDVAMRVAEAMGFHLPVEPLDAAKGR